MMLTRSFRQSRHRATSSAECSRGASTSLRRAGREARESNQRRIVRHGSRLRCVCARSSVSAQRSARTVSAASNSPWSTGSGQGAECSHQGQSSIRPWYRLSSRPPTGVLRAIRRCRRYPRSIDLASHVWFHAQAESTDTILVHNSDGLLRTLRVRHRESGSVAHGGGLRRVAFILKLLPRAG
jgi:hypothetical protein